MQNTHLTILTGASRGMGLAIARQLIAQDHQLLTIARHANDELSTLAAQARTTLTQWELDLAEPQAAAQALHTWLQQHPPAQWASVTLINNAGVIPPIAPISHTDWAAIAHAMRVGLEATMVLTSAFLGATDGWQVPKKVLNISSGLGRRAMASQATYCAAKAGMDNFTACVALEEAHKPYGAKLCALAPGVIDTDMQVQLRSADAAVFPDVGRFQGLHSQHQLTSPADAARQVLAYLADPQFGNTPIADVRQRAS